MRACFILLISLLTFSAAFSQEEPCKPKVKANRELQLIPGKPVPESRTWEEDRTKWVKVYYTPEYDSILVMANDTSAVLLAKDKTIISETYTEYYPDGRISSTDTLTGWSKRPNYIGSYSAKVKSMYKYNEDGSPYSMISYDTTGKISLHKRWYPDGKLAAFHDREKEIQYFEDGSVATFTNKLTNEDRDFFETGKLSFRANDTIVNGVPLTYKVRYYENGNRKYEQWYLRNDTQYGTWRFYDESGKLSSEQKYPVVYNPKAEYNPPAYRSINLTRHASFKKSEKDFILFMSNSLTKAVCESRVPLEGNYELWFRITASGKPEFISVDGKNASGLTSLMQALVVSMPDWEPAYEGQEMASEVFSLSLETSGR